MNWKMPNNFQLNAGIHTNTWKKNFSIHIKKFMGTKKSLSWQLLQLASEQAAVRKCREQPYQDIFLTQTCSSLEQRNTVHQHCSMTCLHSSWCQFRASRMMSILQKQADVWYSQSWDELPQVTPSKSIPRLQVPKNLMCRISKGFCFVSNALCLPPAPSSEASHYCEHSTCPAAGTQPCCHSSCCFPENVTTFQKDLE